MSLARFKDIHAGETMLLVGNGKNLHLTPPQDFDYPSIGMNTIHLYDGFIPNYYIAVDRRVDREFGKDILKKFSDIPIFIADRMGREWSGDNVIRWKYEPGPLWGIGKGSLFQKDIGNAPISYGNVMHVALKFAFYMGAKTILIVGMEHDPENMTSHFWTDNDEGMGVNAPRKEWLEGYRQLVTAFRERGVNVLNISENSYVPAEIIPSDNWEKYSRNEGVFKWLKKNDRT